MTPIPRPLRSLLGRLPVRRPVPRPLVDRDHLPSVYLPEPPTAPAPRAPAIPEPTWEPWLIDQQDDGLDTGPRHDAPDGAVNACVLDGAPYDGDGVLGRYCSWACADADEPISLLGDTPTR
ncbi:hypothetical protein ACFVXH_39680 [Kitasatospora sp. NPDC058184]|uniref:hypothetical protein n=1 Tax=Kitasatospora sp. NPDC058184 TaxID=3346370 RepID=UPI0036DAB738